MKDRRFFAVACASAMLLISARAFADDATCRDAFNKANRNVGNQEQKANRKCIKDNLTGDATGCVDGESLKAAGKRLKVEELFAPGGKCNPNAAFGVNAAPGNGDDAVDAVEDGTDNILRDLWGDPVVDGIVPGDKCADAVAKRGGKIYDTILKAFRKCNKDTSPPNLPAEEGCILGAIGDPKVAIFAGKLANDVTNKCSATPPIVGGTEDGKCAGEITLNDFSDCAVDDAKCNACLAINEMIGGDANCDLLDDGNVNASCGDGPSQHACAFDGAGDNSALTLCLLGVCPSAIDINGQVEIDCPGDPDVNGKRACGCQLIALSPFLISGIGYVCTSPAGPCADGEQDCNGGNALNVDMIADHNSTTCTSNAGCATSCDSYCGSISKVRYNSGCESYCQGGPRSDLPCICDVSSGATCSGGISGVNDCPGGSCEGHDNDVAPDQCHCWCVDEAVAPASPAGALQCRIGVAIRVEAALPCDNAGVLVRLPAQCAPFTSNTAAVTVLNANELPGTQGPYSDSGANETCANFDASVTTGYELVANLAFLDSTIGDLEARLRIDCQ